MGLDYCHSMSVCHRDIKADNVLLFDGLKCKLCDFGLAKRKIGGMSSSRHSAVGTPEFMAPEVTMGLGASFKSDVFSYGMTCLQIIGRRVPDRYRSFADRIADSFERISPSSHVTSLRGLIARCLNSEPNSRPFANDLLSEMQSIVTNICGPDPRLSSSLSRDKQLVKQLDETCVQFMTSRLSEVPSSESKSIDSNIPSSRTS